MTEHDDTRSEGPMAWLAAACGTPTDRRNNMSFLRWTLAWAVGLTASAQSLKRGFFGLEPGSLATWVVASAPAVLGVLMMAAYLRFLRETDELTRLIQLQSLAVGFGAGVLLLLHWELFEFVGAPAMDPSDAVMVPMLAWAGSLLFFSRRYR